MQIFVCKRRRDWSRGRPLVAGWPRRAIKINEETEHHMEIITKTLGESDDKITAWAFSSE